MEEEKKSNNKTSKILNFVFGGVIVALLATSGVFIGLTVNNSNKVNEIQTKVDSQNTVITSLNNQVSKLETDLSSTTAELNKVKNTFSVYYLIDDEIVHKEDVLKGENVKNIPDLPSSENYITSWSVDGKNIQSDTIVTVKYTPKELPIKYNWGKCTTFDTTVFYHSEDYDICRSSSGMSIISSVPIGTDKKFTVQNMDGDNISYQFTDNLFTKINHLTDGYDDYDFTGCEFDVFGRSGDFTKEFGVTYYVSFDNTNVWTPVADFYGQSGNNYYVYLNNKIEKFVFSDDMSSFTYTKDGASKTGSISYYVTDVDNTIYHVDFVNSKVLTKDKYSGNPGEVPFVDYGFNVTGGSNQYKVNFDVSMLKCFVLGNKEYKPNASAKLPTTYKYGESIFIENIQPYFESYIKDDALNPYEFDFSASAEIGTSTFDYFGVFGANSKRASGIVETIVLNPTGEVSFYIIPTPPLS